MSNKGKNFDTIKMFIEHIFGDESEKGFDYLQLLFTNEEQKLPALVLHSEGNCAGKSTFTKLVASILENKAVFIKKEALESEFGTVEFSEKLLAICEEELIDREKDLARMKYLITADKIRVEPQCKAAYSVPLHVKFIESSNNLSESDLRKRENGRYFWTVKVPSITKRNPTILAEMKAEIPAFLDWLKGRKMVHKRVSRLYF